MPSPQPAVTGRNRPGAATGLNSYFGQTIGERMQTSSAIPLLRIFSETKAKEFYIDFLGFSVDWEHRFEKNFPLYLQARRGDLVVHLTEHHGDATPGSTIFVPVIGVGELHAELTAKNYGYSKPSIQDTGWGQVLEVIDPFGNRIRFCELSGD
nr:glyoxalase superfamily protein [Azotobacter chroococcum]